MLNLFHVSDRDRPTKLRFTGRGIALSFAAAGVGTVLILAGCGMPSEQVQTPSPPIVMTGAQWCGALHTRLMKADVGWPIANQQLSATQLVAIHSAFSDLAPQTTGDLNTVAKAWLEGFEAARPYLLSGDQIGFNSNVSASLRRQLELANVSLANICQWDEW